MTRDFNQAVEAFVSRQNIPLVTFERGERKDDVAPFRRSRL
jgi:hypothetical protein